MKKIVIIGGGISGLATAYELLKLGDYDVTIVEKDDAAGGLARSIEHNGFLTDLGPHRLNTELPEVHELIEEIAGEKVIALKRQSKMRLGRRYIEYPVKPFELALTIGPFKPAWFMLSFMLHQALHGRKEIDGTLEQYMMRAFGPSLYHYLFKPYVEKMWKMDATELSDQIGRVRLTVGGLDKLLKGLLSRDTSPEATGALRESYYLRGGINELAKHYLEKIEAAGGRIMTGAKVTGIEASDAQLNSVQIKTGGAHQRLECDILINTIPLPLFLPMLLRHRPSQAAADTMKRLRYLYLRLVCLIVERGHVSANHWLYFPGADLIFNRGHEAKNFDESMAPAGQSLICLEVTCHEGDELANMPREELIRRVRTDIVGTGLMRDDEIVDAFVQDVPWAYPVYYKDYAADLSVIWDYLAGFPNLLSCGRQGLYNHNNIDHSIVMGLACARCIHQNESPAQAWPEKFSAFDQFRIVD
ncbi:FAD-dependent oxidoreductase [Candidatus Sumerlaeota bacterium]|nr:FAD-dependent oxidoreductase [Candidatus Sumerlaeota bacterium]